MVINARSVQTDSAAVTLAPFIEQLPTLLADDHAPAWLTVERLLDHVLAPLHVRQLLGYTNTHSGARDLVEAVLADSPARSPRPR